MNLVTPNFGNGTTGELIFLKMLLNFSSSFHLIFFHFILPNCFWIIKQNAGAAQLAFEQIIKSETCAKTAILPDDFRSRKYWMNSLSTKIWFMSLIITMRIILLWRKDGEDSVPSELREQVYNHRIATEYRCDKPSLWSVDD